MDENMNTNRRMQDSKAGHVSAYLPDLFPMLLNSFYRNLQGLVEHSVKRLCAHPLQE